MASHNRECPQREIKGWSTSQYWWSVSSDYADLLSVGDILLVFRGCFKYSMIVW